MPDANLFKISNCDAPGRQGDVVFIHGLGGDAYSTWHPCWQPKHPNQNFWLAWLGEERPDLGIWSLHYSIEPFSWRGNTMPLVDRAVNVLDRLGNYRIGTRPLVFVTHSMGGLLVKQMLRHAKDFGNASWSATLNNTQGIVFLSTPHSGATLANWIKFFSGILKSTVSVDELEASHPRLRELNLLFRNDQKLREIPIQVYFETQATHGVKVVDSASADPGILGVMPIPIDANHLSICRPESHDSQVYLGVKSFLAKNIKFNNKDPEDRPPTPKTLSALKGDYASLTRLLKKKDWKSADNETMEVILGIIKRRQEEKIRTKDVKDLPCSDLLKMNELWLEGSHNHFGFSIQRDIWLNLEKKDFYSFANEVGWYQYETNSWLQSYDDFSFSLDAPRGHLPSLRIASMDNDINCWMYWKVLSKNFRERMDFCLR